MVCLVSADARIVEVNRAMLRTANRTREELIGRLLHETYAVTYSAEVQARARAPRSRKP